MPNVTVTKDRYTIDDPLYQWDVNKVLEIRGLSLPSIPEIHFTNNTMERAIVRQARMDDAGIITVDVPNSLLQKPSPVIVYVCIYEGDTFESLYKIEVPLKARKQPTDYVFVDNAEEIYSFNALENKLDNTIALSLARYDEVNTKYENLVEDYTAKTAELTAEREELIVEREEINTRYTGACDTLDQAVENYDNAKSEYEDASAILTECETATEECNQIINDAKDGIGGKENKATISEATLLASGWSGNTYSFETDYPVATYNLEIALDSIATVDQVDAFNSAQIVGSATTNIVTAFGDVPTIDIPIILKAVIK